MPALSTAPESAAVISARRRIASTMPTVATGSERGPHETPPLSTTSVLALIVSVGAFLVGGLWLAAVVLGPLTQPYCGVPHVPDGCGVDSSYWWWAVPPAALVAGAVTLAIVVVRRSRQLDRDQT